MPIPTNTTSATALLIPSLPYTVTLDAALLAPSAELWFRYDKTVGGNTVLVLAQPVPIATGTYLPRIRGYYADEDGILQSLDIAGTIQPITTPIGSLVITSYYWSVEQAGGVDPFTEQLLFQAVAGPGLAAPAGSIVVNDDTPGLPVAIVDYTTGEILQQQPFPAGERADVLPGTGESLWHDEDAQTLALYDNQFARIATLTWDRLTQTLAEPAIASNHDDQFYVAVSGVFGLGTFAQVRTVLPSGVFGPTTWELGIRFLRSIAVSPDDTILYYVEDVPTASATPIARWDLVNDVALSDLVVTPSTFPRGRDLLSLADGSIVYVAASGSTDDFVLERYSAAGALLHSYTYTAGWRLNRLAYRTGTTFMAWFFSVSTPGLARFVAFTASDGAVISSVETPVSSGGVWQGENPGTPETAIASSCPFILLPPPGLPALTFPGFPGFPGSVPPYVAPSYHLDARYIRRLRRAPHVANDNLRVFVRQFELDLERGQGLPSGQGSDPVVLLRLSRDGGQTWGEEVRMHAGALGAYTQRVLARRLGQARDTVFEVTVSDPIAWSLVGAWLDVEPGQH